MLTGVYLIVTSGAYDDQVAFDILPASTVVLKVMQLKDTGVVPSPPITIPAAHAAGILVACVDLSLYVFGNTAVVRFRDAFGGLGDVLAYVQVGTAGEPCCDCVAVFGAKLPNTASVFLGILRYADQLLTSASLAKYASFSVVRP